MKQWFEDWMAEIFLFGLFLSFFGGFVFLCARQTYIENGRIYTMTVDVYYTDTPERHTYVSDGIPIVYSSIRGTSRVAGEVEYVLTTAPIKVISNTYIEKK